MKLATVVELLDLALSVRQFVSERSTVYNLTLARSMADFRALGCVAWWLAANAHA